MMLAVDDLQLEQTGLRVCRLQHEQHTYSTVRCIVFESSPPFVPRSHAALVPFLALLDHTQVICA